MRAGMISEIVGHEADARLRARFPPDRRRRHDRSDRGFECFAPYTVGLRQRLGIVDVVIGVEKNGGIAARKPYGVGLGQKVQAKFARVGFVAASSMNACQRHARAGPSHRQLGEQCERPFRIAEFELE